MTDFYEQIQIYQKSVETALEYWLPSIDLEPKKLHEAMHYSVLAEGKRIRPILLYATGQAFGVELSNMDGQACAVEIMHAYSLIHDDLPSMDNDDFRRGKASVHKKFNEFTAILAGNSLLTWAFEILSGDDLKISQNFKNQLINSLSKCSGHLGLAGGQYSDLTFENKNISKINIIDMQIKKTGKLFGFCCESVAIIKGLSLVKRKQLKDIGLNIGLLFQIVDDLIDYKGNSFKAGKPTRSDKKKGKATLVNLLGYKETIIFAEKIKKKLDKKIKKYGNKSNDLLESIDFILKREF